MRKQFHKSRFILMCSIMALSLASLTITGCGKKEKKLTAEQYNESVAAENKAKSEAEAKAKAEAKAQKEADDKAKFYVKSEEEKIDDQIEENNKKAEEEFANQAVVVSRDEVPVRETEENPEESSEAENNTTNPIETTAASTDSDTETESPSESSEPSENTTEEYTYYDNPEISDPIDNGDGTVSYDIYSLEDGAMNKFFGYIHSGAYDKAGIEGLMEDARSFFETYPDDVKNACYSEIQKNWEEHQRRKTLWTEEELAEDSERLFYSSREEYEKMRNSWGDSYVPSSQW